MINVLGTLRVSNMAADAASLTPEEELATKKFLEVVNKVRAELRRGPVSWNTAVKFLMARKFDMNRALELYETHGVIRLRDGLINIIPNEEPLWTELQTGKFTVLPSRESSGASVALFSARLHLPHKCTQQTVLKSVVFQLDHKLTSVETQRNGLVFIYDMTSSTYMNFDYDLCTKILNLLKGAYPARLKKVLIVQPPLWFRAPFKLLRLFVKEKLRERVFLVKVQDISKHVSMDVLPKHFGGAISLGQSHLDWLQACLKFNLNGYRAATDTAYPPYTLTERDTPSSSQTPSSSRSSSGASSSPSISGSTPPPPLSTSTDSDDVQQDGDPDGPFSDPFSPTGIHHRNGNIDVMNDPPAQPGSFVADDFLRPPPAPPTRSQSLQQQPTHNVTSIHQPDYTGFTLTELVDHLTLIKQNGVYEEFEEIRSAAAAGSFHVSKLRINASRNRYTDVLCLDKTRVKLRELEATPSNDYVNANYMDGYNQKSAYIATQGPLPHTCADFWQMVWREQVRIIVMTTKVIEKGRNKCYQYWPSGQGEVEIFGDFRVQTTSKNTNQIYITSTLTITNMKNDEFREVIHYQFVSWPDFGVPSCPRSLLTFIQVVQQHRDEFKSVLSIDPPIVIHCSAGIGRTGTYCALEISLKMLIDIGKVHLDQTVRLMRTQRAFSVQTADQYEFCYFAIVEFAQGQGLIDHVDLGDYEMYTDSD